MALSNSELILIFSLLLIGLLGNLQIYFNKADNRKWNSTIYPAVIIFLVCGFVTEPSLLENILISGPLVVFQLLIVRSMTIRRNRREALAN